MRPRLPAPTTVPEVLVSEEDRSWGAGLVENSRRIDAPILEARLGRVSSLFKSTELGFDIWSIGSRTIPEDGTADNLSIAGGILLDVSGVDPCPMVRRTLSLSGTLEEVTVLSVILE